MPAKLHVRIPSGTVRVFVAGRCDVEHGAVTATGYWKGSSNQSSAAYTWPIARVLRIRREA